MAKIKVALVGVGNCASAFVQGLQYYKDCYEKEKSIGLRHLYLGGFHPRDIQIVAAFDIDARKVGKDLSDAIFAAPNNFSKMLDVSPLDVKVLKGPVLDGIGEYTRDVVEISNQSQTDVAKALKENDAEIMVNLLPSGALKASQWYAEQAMAANCAFVNVTPNFIASDLEWAKKFENAEVPLVGDDLIDQVGATTLHKTLLKLLSTHGVCIIETYQLDVGGGTESLHTLERAKELKRIVKTRSVETALPYKAEVVAGSTDFVDFLENRRDSYFWIRGIYFCNTPMQIDLKLSTIDAPNAGSVLLDVIRAVKIALNRKLKGAILPICAYAFKRPPRLVSLEAAEEMFTNFINEKTYE